MVLASCYSNESIIRNQLELVYRNLNAYTVKSGGEYPSSFSALVSLQNIPASEITQLSGRVVFCNQGEPKNYMTPRIIYKHTSDTNEVLRVVYDGGGVRMIYPTNPKYQLYQATGGMLAPSPSLMSTNGIKVRFLNEASQPLDGVVSVHEFKDNCFIGSWYRDVPLDENGCLELPDMPSDFRLIVNDLLGFYKGKFTNKDIDHQESIITATLVPGGIISCLLSQNIGKEKTRRRTLLAICERQNRSGLWCSHSIVSIRRSSKVFHLLALEEGTYRISVYDSNNKDNLIGRAENIEVISMETIQAKVLPVR